MLEPKLHLVLVRGDTVARECPEEVVLAEGGDRAADRDSPVRDVRARYSGRRQVVRGKRVVPSMATLRYACSCPVFSRQ